jgi:hypothetical protein
MKRREAGVELRRLEQVDHRLNVSLGIPAQAQKLAQAPNAKGWLN